MKIYTTKVNKIAGTYFPDIRKNAFAVYLKIKKRSKRKPYVKSPYFKKEKIFLDLFWTHLFEKKNYLEQIRRMKFFPCGVDLLIKSKIKPTSKINPNDKNEILHRFIGKTKDGEVFFVQVKENLKNGSKRLISVFPEK